MALIVFIMGVVSAESAASGEGREVITHTDGQDQVDGPLSLIHRVAISAL